MDKKKRQVLPPGLWVVATPIGNLEDLSPRARQALEEADAVLCEDTRRTAQLFSALSLPRKSLERLDAHSSPKQLERYVERLGEGQSFALVSDAGTPAISDPGSKLVALARKRGIAITPVPGPSAVAALLSVCGFEETAFVFRGFFPRKSAERAEELERVNEALAAASARVFVWFESPERIADALQYLAEKHPETEVVAAKELTKLHERLFAGSAREVSGKVRAEIDSEGARGEWCLAAHFVHEVSKSSDWVKALHCLLDAQVSAPEAARQVSQHFGAARKDVYELALRILGKKISQGG